MRNTWIWSVGLVLATTWGGTSAQSETPPPPPPAPPAPTATPSSPECAGLISIVYRPPTDGLLPLLQRVRAENPFDTTIGLTLHYTIDAGGAPTHVSIAKSTKDRDADKAALEWGRGVRFNGAPGCSERMARLPVAL